MNIWILTPARARAPRGGEKEQLDPWKSRSLTLLRCTEFWVEHLFCILSSPWPLHIFRVYRRVAFPGITRRVGPGLSRIYSRCTLFSFSNVLPDRVQRSSFSHVPSYLGVYQAGVPFFSLLLPPSPPAPSPTASSMPLRLSHPFSSSSHVFSVLLYYIQTKGITRFSRSSRTEPGQNSSTSTISSYVANTRSLCLTVLLVKPQCLYGAPLQFHLIQ